MTMSIENATVTVTDENNVRYVHDFVTNITITDPRENVLSSSPQGGGKGIAYRTGNTSQVTTDMIVRGLPVGLVNLYKKAFKNKSRLDVMIVDARTNERYDLNDSIVRSNPTNATITEGEATLDQSINFGTSPSGFDHDSGE